MFKKLHFQEVRRPGAGRETGPAAARRVSVTRLQVSVCQVFREVTLRATVDESVRATLLEDFAHVEERDYGQTRSGRRGHVSRRGAQKTSSCGAEPPSLS